MPGVPPAEKAGPSLTARAAAFGEVVLEGPLSVPLNQRPWEWGEGNLDDLFDDLVATTDRWCVRNNDGTWSARRDGARPMPHFFGPLVLEADPSIDGMSVVDGQQRLTAATVLVAGLRDVAEGLRAVPKPGGPAARALGNALGVWLQGDGGSSGGRLRLDSTVSDFFDAYVVQSVGDEERAVLAAETAAGPDADGADVRTALVEAVKHLARRVAEHLQDRHPDGDPAAVVSRVACLYETLRDRFETIVIEVMRPGMSPQLFSGLNARGTPLNEADKIKNELFVVSPDDHHADIKQQWDRMVRALPSPWRDAETFLRLRHVAFVGDTKQSELYGTIRREELTGVSGQPAVTRWAEDAGLLRIVHGLEAHDSVGEDVRRHLLDIRLMRHTYAWPLLLASARAYLKADAEAFAEAVLLTRNVSFRELAMGRTQPETFLNRTAPLARAVSAGASVADLRAGLAKISPDDEFAIRFAAHYEPRAPQQYYILYNLELAAGAPSGVVPAPHSPDPRDNQNNIEHIYPKKPSRRRTAEFATWRDPDDPTGRKKNLVLARRYLHRIGNLLLIEHKINSELGDFGFDSKQTGVYPENQKVDGRARYSYKDSRLALPKRLASRRDWPEWTPDAVESRQEQLAVLAAKAWRIAPARRRRNAAK